MKREGKMEDRNRGGELGPISEIINTPLGGTEADMLICLHNKLVKFGQYQRAHYCNTEHTVHYPWSVFCLQPQNIFTYLQLGASG